MHIYMYVYQIYVSTLIVCINVLSKYASMSVSKISMDGFTHVSKRMQYHILKPSIK